MEIVRSVYEALNSFNWDRAFRNTDPDFTMTTQLGPEAGTRRGRQEVVAFMEDYAAAFDRLTWEPEKFFEREGQVVALVSIRGRPQGVGADIVIRNGHLWTIREGVLLSVNDFPRPHDALEAAELSE